MNNIDIKALFESFNDLKVLIIGDVMIDSYMWGTVDRISPEAPVPIVASTKTENRLGGAANVALNVQALGATPILCAIVGEDPKSDIFYQLMKKRELSSEGIVQVKDRPTTVKTRIISDNQHLLRVDEEITHEMDNESENIFIDRVKSIISKGDIDAIIFEDYDKGCITHKIIKETVNFANERDVPTLVDPKKRHYSHYKNVTLFKPNFKELTEGQKVDLRKDDFESIFKVSKDFQEEKNIKYVLVTLSELGVFISDGKSYTRLPAEIRDIADVSGAGDTLISVASLCLAKSLQPELIAGISNLAGGIVCEKVGVVPVNKDFLLEESLAKYQD